MARIDHIFKTETKKVEHHPRRNTKWIHYSKLVDHKKQYCNAKDKEEIEMLADLIEADGEVLQDLLVRKIDTDAYEIIAGHKRRRACQLLVEERGREQYALLPCLEREMSDVRAEFQLYSSNRFHEKTDYEKMLELESMKYLLETYPEEFPEIQTGRIVERLARLLNMNKTTVGEYLTISKNLSDKGMEKFQSGEIKKSAAVELSGLPEEEQDALIEQGITTHAEIKRLKKKKKEKPAPKIETADQPDAQNTEKEAAPAGSPTEKQDLANQTSGKEMKELLKEGLYHLQKEIASEEWKEAMATVGDIKEYLRVLEYEGRNLG